MEHIFKIHDDKKEICVLLMRNEIAFDVEMESFQIAKAHLADVTSRERHEATVTAALADWLERQIKTAIAYVRKTLNFAVCHASRMATNELQDSPGRYAVSLVFDKEWNGDADVLCDLIHRYVVAYCMCRWIKLRVPSRAAEYEADADKALEDVHDLACNYTVDVRANSYWG